MQISISPNPTKNKICPRCRKSKPLDSFYTNGENDGWRTYCKVCSDKHGKSPIAKVAQLTKLEAQRDEHLRKQKRANSAVARSIKRGGMFPACSYKCVNCGKQAHHYHHDSYLPEHRLNVIPLCCHCHATKHSRIRRHERQKQLIVNTQYN